MAIVDRDSNGYERVRELDENGNWVVVSQHWKYKSKEDQKRLDERTPEQKLDVQESYDRLNKQMYENEGLECCQDDDNYMPDHWWEGE